MGNKAARSQGDQIKLVVLDFDGTLCLGDDPVLLYAQRVDEALAQYRLNWQQHPNPHGQPQGQSTLREIVQRGLNAHNLVVPEIRYDDAGYPSDVEGKTDMALWPLQDGYQLVQLLGLQAGLPVETINTAFRESRTRLLANGLAASDVHAPEHAVNSIARLRETAAVVLITNSPAQDFDVWLAHLGLEHSFDLVINSAQKPAGMADAVNRARNQLSSQNETIVMQQVLSIGDIWGNDLAHVYNRGGATILIDRFATGLGTPTARVATAQAALEHLSHQQVTCK